MGAKNAKAALYEKIENSDEFGVQKILKKFPDLLNAPITNDCHNTALTRSVWRDDKKIVKLLIELGCDVNYSGPRGISPLMWAAKRGHVAMGELLLEHGANLSERSQDEDKFTALEMAIVSGRYQMSLMLLERDMNQLLHLKQSLVYEQASVSKKRAYCNFEQFLEHLKARIPYEACPNFFQKPRAPELNDPVPDPRETWSNFFKRHIEFKKAPMVERQSLPEDLQPQNRFLGKMRQYANGKSPYPSDTQSVQIKNTNTQQMQLKDNISERDCNQSVPASDNQLQSNKKKQKNAVYDEIPKSEIVGKNELNI